MKKVFCFLRNVCCWCVTSEYKIWCKFTAIVITIIIFSQQQRPLRMPKKRWLSELFDECLEFFFFVFRLILSPNRELLTLKRIWVVFIWNYRNDLCVICVTLTMNINYLLELWLCSYELCIHILNKTAIQ